MKLFSTSNPNIYTNFIHYFLSNENNNTVTNTTTGEVFDVLSSETFEYYTTLIVE